SDAPDPRKLSAVSLLLPAKKRTAAHVPHATLAAGAHLPVVPLAGAKQSHPVQPGLRSGYATHGEAHPAYHLLGERDRTRVAGAGYPDTDGSAGPCDPRNVLLDGHPAERTGTPETVRCGPRTRHADDPPGQGKERPYDPDRRAGAGLGRKISARGASAVGRRAG